MVPPIASAATQNIATIAFGVLATLIGAFTLWQGRRTWRRLYRQLRERPAESDLRSQTTGAVELEPRQIFELPVSTLSRSPSPIAAVPAIPEEARLLDPLAASAPTPAPATTTISPA